MIVTIANTFALNLHSRIQMKKGCDFAVNEQPETKVFLKNFVESRFQKPNLLVIIKH